jgi:predicted ATP-binding protein involved in virulence
MSNFITKINIKKVRHLENIDIVLGDEKKHLILTGKNGSGKTSVLEELDSFFSEIYNPIGEEKVKNSDLKFNQNILNIKNENFIYAFFKAQRTINGIDKSTHAEKIIFPKEKTAKLNQLFIRYMVGLKIERAFAKDDKELKLVEKLDRWFDNFEKMLRKIFNDNSLVLKFDRNPFSYNFKIEREGRESFDFYTMSAGYSAIMDIVTELILKIENTKFKSFDCEGIVLIDEVDNHLHVELQKNILPLLTSFFPNIQFIVTTHSPFVLQSIENSVVYDLERKEQLSGKRLHIASYTDIVKNYFEIDSEFSKVLENKIVRYEKLVDQFENNTLDIEREKELLNLDIKLDEIAPMMSKSIFLRFKESQDRINDHGES